jgi:hypothetical protein
MRFSLTQTIANVFVPIAIDSGGSKVYVITDKGLTIVDLGAALLSIGSLNPATATSGQQVVVRGSGFTPSITATVGGYVAGVGFTDENTLTLTVPTGPSGPSDIVVTNSVGDAYTLENGLVVQ